jgi:Tfp pilus assembly protein PilO
MNHILFTAISFLLAIVLGVVLIHPKYQELQLLKEKIEARKVELQSKEDYLQKLKETSQELKEYEAELSIVSSTLPADASLPALLDFLQKVSSENGLILSSTKRAGISALPESEVRETKVALELMGNYPSLKNFLQVVEKSGRLIEIDSISLSVPEAEKPDLFTFDIIIKVYSY